MTIYSRNAQIMGEYRGTDKGVFNSFDAHQLKGLGTWGSVPEAYVVMTLNENTITLSGGTYRVFIGGGGGGGCNTSYDYGGLGGVFWFDVTLDGGTYYAGVGAGGKYNGTTVSNGYRNASGYAMRGGNGEYGRSAGSGSGGGGSYLKAAATPETAHWNNYLGIAGGGGGCASHGFTANFGGHGFGVGGGAYSSDNANYSNGGRNGFDGSGGAGGTPVYGSSSGLYGGNADISGELRGGSAGVGNGHNGGGGGGGAGGGGAGAGGGGQSDAGHGGYISTSTTVGSYTAETRPRGGGGGGGHNNNCGGTGGGGGVLLFADYTNSWTGTTQGGDIPYWSASISSASISHYNAWGDLASYSSSYLGVNLTTNQLSGKCARGHTTTAGGNGFVVIATLNVNTSSNLTYV